MKTLLLFVLFLVGSCGVDESIDQYEKEKELEQIERDREHERKKQQLEDPEEDSSDIDVEVNVNINYPTKHRRDKNVLYYEDTTDDVLRILGYPKAVDGDRWYYDSCARDYGYKLDCWVVISNDVVIEQDNIEPRYLDIRSWL